jgi:hypothetical protein
MLLAAERGRAMIVQVDRPGAQTDSLPEARRPPGSPARHPKTRRGHAAPREPRAERPHPVAQAGEKRVQHAAVIDEHDAPQCHVEKQRTAGSKLGRCLEQGGQFDLRPRIRPDAGTCHPGSGGHRPKLADPFHPARRQRFGDGEQVEVGRRRGRIPGPRAEDRQCLQPRSERGVRRLTNRREQVVTGADVHTGAG